MEIQRHEEAGSVNIKTVEEEQAHIRELLARFQEVMPPPLKEVMKMCHILEEYSMVICPQGAFNFVKALCEYQGHLQKMIREGEKQTMFNTFFVMRLSISCNTCHI